jgi:uncharacterized protein YsxB (DUF464 family)
MRMVRKIDKTVCCAGVSQIAFVISIWLEPIIEEFEIGSE